jgi:predicted SnoaL-like aldol condensation-catalyzing enzyme
MTNREKATKFLELVCAGKIDEGFTRFISPDFIHHNQYFKGDRASLNQAMKEAHRQSPNKAVEIKYCYEDGETVITHSRVINEAGDIAVAHIFRFENGDIKELWDLGQLIDSDSPNENGLF